MQRALQHMTTV